jgi:hypothetical protein
MWFHEFLLSPQADESSNWQMVGKPELLVIELGYGWHMC